MTQLIESGSLLLALLNPFLVIVYLVDPLQTLSESRFRGVLVRAGLIATGVFCAFAVVGDAVFSEVVHAEFASFQIFGGIIFLLIGIQFVFRGPSAIQLLRGESAHIAGAVAMPVLIGPGTISASVIIGERHDAATASGIVAGAMVVSILLILILKSVHDYVRPRNEPLVERYIEVAGRITALYVGTVSVDMIMQGLDVWLDKL